MNDVKFSSLQSFASVDSTGTQSTNYIDLEENGVADEHIGPGWLNVVAGDDVSVSALTEGLQVKLVTSDSTTLASGNVDVVSSGIILPGRLVKGFRQSYGFNMSKLHRYLRVLVQAINTSEGGGTLTFDIWLSDQPLSQKNIQKEMT